MSTRDRKILEAIRRSEPKAAIARRLGIGRMTVYRVLARHREQYQFSHAG